MVKFYQITSANKEEDKGGGGRTRCNFQGKFKRVLIVHHGEYIRRCTRKMKRKAACTRGGCVSRARGGSRKMKEKGNFIRNASGCGNPNLDLNSRRERKITTLLRLALMHSCPHWEAIRDCYGNPALFASRPLRVHLTSVCLCVCMRALHPDSWIEL